MTTAKTFADLDRLLGHGSLGAEAQAAFGAKGQPRREIPEAQRQTLETLRAGISDLADLRPSAED